jgi:hypothetical protein
MLYQPTRYSTVSGCLCWNIPQEAKLINALFRVAASCVQGAMLVLTVLIAFGMMLGGRKGALWVVNTAISPIKAAFQKKLTALIYLCMFVILSYYLGSRLLTLLDSSSFHAPMAPVSSRIMYPR